MRSLDTTSFSWSSVSSSSFSLAAKDLIHSFFSRIFLSTVVWRHASCPLIIFAFLLWKPLYSCVSAKPKPSWDMLLSWNLTTFLSLQRSQGTSKLSFRTKDRIAAPSSNQVFAITSYYSSSCAGESNCTRAYSFIQRDGMWGNGGARLQLLSIIFLLKLLQLPLAACLSFSAFEFSYLRKSNAW